VGASVEREEGSPGAGRHAASRGGGAVGFRQRGRYDRGRRGAGVVGMRAAAG
jgi:hypothetical protein